MRFQSLDPDLMQDHSWIPAPLGRPDTGQARRPRMADGRAVTARRSSGNSQEALPPTRFCTPTRAEFLERVRPVQGNSFERIDLDCFRYGSRSAP